MKQLNKALSNFITTFELEHPTKGICFDAKIYLFAGQTKIEAESEIHIVSIDGKGLDVLYILNPAIEIEGFPDMFIIEDFEVSFNLKQGLQLTGLSSRWGTYTMVIQPTGKDCTAPTYREINQKNYN